MTIKQFTEPAVMGNDNGYSDGKRQRNSKVENSPAPSAEIMVNGNQQ